VQEAPQLFRSTDSGIALQRTQPQALVPRWLVAMRRMLHARPPRKSCDIKGRVANCEQKLQDVRGATAGVVDNGAYLPQKVPHCPDADAQPTTEASTAEDYAGPTSAVKVPLGDC